MPGTLPVYSSPRAGGQGGERAKEKATTEVVAITGTPPTVAIPRETAASWAWRRSDRQPIADPRLLYLSAMLLSRAKQEKIAPTGSRGYYGYTGDNGNPPQGCRVMGLPVLD